MVSIKPSRNLRDEELLELLFRCYEHQCLMLQPRNLILSKSDVLILVPQGYVTLEEHKEVYGIHVDRHNFKEVLAALDNIHTDIPDTYNHKYLKSKEELLVSWEIIDHPESDFGKLPQKNLKVPAKTLELGLY